ncbi:MAG: nucleotide exchange factor GrpE [Acidobacteria bacterium]|nr:nucleotide exchange factor GrpE [Acidobacteriota bacterium]
MPANDPHALPGDGEDLVDITLEDSSTTDLQALADEIASITPSPGQEPEDPGEAAASSVSVEDLQKAYDNAQDRNRIMEAAQAEMVEQHRRLAADFANFRARAARDTQLGVELAERKLLLEFLQVLDNFERSLDATYPTVEAFRSGIELIHKQFHDVLRRVGVRPLEVRVGDPFDATHAEALTTVHTPDLPDQAVANVFERGFMLRENLLRPARVLVNHLPAPECGGEAGGTEPVQ